MITFKPPENLNNLNSHDPEYPVVKKLVEVLINALHLTGTPLLVQYSS